MCRGNYYNKGQIKVNIDDYIHPVTISYNRELLQQIVNRIKIWPSYSPDSGKTTLDHKDILFPVNLEAYRIKNFLLESTLYSFSWVPPMTETGYHTDSNRGCTLILPIDNIPHLIQFKDNDQTFDYYYSGPVLTNGKTYHNGINNTNHDRFNLLFHFDKPYSYILELEKQDKLVSKWSQSYPIKSNIKNDLLYRYFNLTNMSDTTIDYIDGGIAINQTQKILYKTASDFDICQSIKYMLDNPIVKKVELE